MNRRRAITLLSALGFLLIAVMGCRPSDRLRTYPTSGRVLDADRKPLASGTVLFESVEHGLIARGQIGADGQVKLETYGDGDGAVLGRHRAVVIPGISANVDRDANSRRMAPVHTRYTRFEDSGLEFEVREAAENVFEFVLSG
ncbi:MAG: hypothetical protein R3E01_28540 [Pirellulaceae bacterium]|nr:carboxypeptidase regulatory-like domain-containing protein [Planctomycetales bacterium]